MTDARKSTHAIGSDGTGLNRLIGFDVRIADWEEVRQGIKDKDNDATDTPWFQKEPLPRADHLGHMALCVWVVKKGEISGQVRAYLAELHEQQIIRLLPPDERP